ncbi:MAG: DNA-formamidopyrimidine glycosylase [Anaerolineales bacterium]|nr:MAG: DNA-formamidopyrimidine glycosylase [Anaerolineales bacterium]
MPELPEVETIARILRLGMQEQPALPGRHILGVELLWARSLAEPIPAEFTVRLPGQVIEDIGRRGKFLVFRLSRDWLLFHLRMSGDLLVRPACTNPANHDRLVLQLEGGYELAFNDARKFGRVWLVNEVDRVLGGLGPEPLDESLTAHAIFERLHTSHRQLKPLLLDQTFIAGLGNIYVDEALNLARLHPLMSSHAITEKQTIRLLASIRAVLRDGIARNGASIDWVYRGGDFQNYFRVYQRTGLPCPECGTPIARTIVGQRGTHFCPSCQPAPCPNGG